MPFTRAMGLRPLPLDILMQTSDTYRALAERITGEALVISDNPRAEIIDTLAGEFGLID